MLVGLFIPCYIDQFFPGVAKATLDLLESHGVEVDFPLDQSCCGQPMANTGCHNEARPVAQKWVRTFSKYDAVVCPSGSCTSMVRNHYEELMDTEREAYAKIKEKTFELSEFLLAILKIESLEVSFPHKVGIHQSCHGLRELRLGSGSERNVDDFSKTHQLLSMVQDIEIVDLDRPDECCGFGGTFAVAEEAVSCSMGRDRLDDHQRQGVEVIVGGDSSCLMHLDGLSRREGRELRFMHFAEILAGHP